MTAKIFFNSFTLLLLLFVIGGASLAFIPSTSVKIESFESKTAKGHPVFNKISYIDSPQKDVWLMQQSHDGAEAPLEAWDVIKIVVDKRQNPYLVSYHQVKAGKELSLIHI